MSKIDELKRQKSDLQQQIKTLISKLNQAREKKNSIVMTRERNISTFDQLVKIRNELVRSTQSLGQTYEQEAVIEQDLVNKLNPLIREAEEIGSRLKAIITQIHKKEARMKELDSEHRRTNDPYRKRALKNDQDTIQKQVSELFNTCNQLKKRSETLALIVGPLRRQYDQKNQRLAGIKNQIEANYKEKVDIDKKINDFSEKFTTTSAEHEKILLQISAFSEQLEKLQGTLRDIDSEIRAESKEKQIQATYSLLLGYLKEIPKVACRISPHPACRILNVIEIAEFLYNYYLDTNSTYSEKMISAFYDLVKLFVEKKFEPIVGPGASIVLKNIEYALSLLREVHTIAPAAEQQSAGLRLH